MLLPWTWLLIWRLLYADASCVVLLILLVPVVALIALNMLEVALTRRHAFIGTYLQAGKGLYRFLRGGVFTVAWQVVKALAFGLTLLVESIAWDWWVWLLLFADVLIIQASYAWCCRKLAAQVKPDYETILARRFLVVINTVLGAVMISAVTLYTPQKDYRELTWLEAAEYEAAEVEVRCDVLGILARLSASKNAVAWWLAQTWLTRLQNLAAAVLGWSIFLLSSAAFMWAYSRLLFGSLAQPFRLLARVHAQVRADE